MSASSRMSTSGLALDPGQPGTWPEGGSHLCPAPSAHWLEHSLDKEGSSRVYHDVKVS